MDKNHFDGLVQECTNSIANTGITAVLLKPSILSTQWDFL